LKGFSQYSKYVAVAGLNSIATRATRGAISLSSSSHLPAIVGSIVTKPVTFPPGCGKLATKPLPIGSATSAKTMGMVRVSCNIVAVIGVLCVRMRSGCSATSSFATRCIDTTSPVVIQRLGHLEPSILRRSGAVFFSSAYADSRHGLAGCRKKEKM
jgi:hypothetical protein